MTHCISLDVYCLQDEHIERQVLQFQIGKVVALSALLANKHIGKVVALSASLATNKPQRSFDPAR